MIFSNLASLGTGQAATMGAQQMASQRAASQFGIGAAQTTQAATADILGGAANIYSGYLRSQPVGAAPAGTVAGDAYQPAYQAGYI